MISIMMAGAVLRATRMARFPTRIPRDGCEMTEIEQVIASLILDLAENSSEKKLKTTATSIREQTVGVYRLDGFPGAFEAALDFLIEQKCAKLHQYSGVEDYVSVALPSGIDGTFFHLKVEGGLKKDDSFLFENEKSEYPIIASYLDVGSGFIHDLALSFRDNNSSEKKDLVDSGAWTGRYVVSAEIRSEISNKKMTNAERSNALAGINAIDKLLEAEDPPWSIIIKILQSPLFANLTALAALAVSIIKA